MKISSKLRLAEGEKYIHWCPGCKMAHCIDVGTPNKHTGAIWTFNNDVVNPTFQPSINIVGMCHYFIRNGNIEFCGDSKHDLAGTTVVLPDFDDRDYDDL